MQTQGKLFVFEGPDGTGKTTLASGLESHLTKSGKKSLLLGFPGNEQGTLGHHVYEIHHNKERLGIKSLSPSSLQLLHVAAHIDAIENIIIPNLDSGMNIILDRYWWSTWVYGIINGVDKKSLDLMIKVELFFWDEYLPSKVFLIDRKYPLRDDVQLEKWNKLRKMYLGLIGSELQNDLIHVIHNDGLPESALKKIKGVIDNNPQIQDQSNSNIVANQLDFSFSYPLKSHLSENETKESYKDLFPVIPTDVYDTYWFFAAKRQDIFFKKFHGEKPPWTNDPILVKYKFTNAYRASDRVSQYLIKNVIYKGDQSPDELFFRILLFKIFNRIETWGLFQKEIKDISYSSYSFDRYDKVLTSAMESGVKIFSSAYIMPSGSKSFGYPKKHQNFLMLIDKMIDDEVPNRIAESHSMQKVFNLLRSYPMLGDFLAYQYLIDINYSEMTNFSESEFVVPGPGARDGIRKVFKDFGGLNEVDLIKLVCERQETEFSRLGLTFKSLWGRKLQLIDCQNLFCEVDKYSRVAHPEIPGRSKRKRIKHKYHYQESNIDPWYPPKWGINKLIIRNDTQANS